MQINDFPRSFGPKPCTPRPEHLISFIPAVCIVGLTDSCPGASELHQLFLEPDERNCVCEVIRNCVELDGTIGCTFMYGSASLNVHRRHENGTLHVKYGRDEKEFGMRKV